MASEPAEPTTRPQDDRVGTVRRLGNSWFVKLVEPASEPWHVVCSDGQQDVSGWQDDESMEDCPVVGYLPVVECVPSLLADPAQTTELEKLRAQRDAAQSSSNVWKQVAEQWEQGHQNTVLPYTTKLEEQRDALSLLLRGMARKLVATRAERVTLERILSKERRKVDAARAPLTRLAELAEQAGKLRTTEWLRTCANLTPEEWPPAPAYKGPMVPAAEAHERQARIDAVLALHAPHSDTDQHCKACGVDVYENEIPWPCATVAALVGDQPKAEEPLAWCSGCGLEVGTNRYLNRCGTCGEELQPRESGPKRGADYASVRVCGDEVYDHSYVDTTEPLSGAALRAVEEADDAAGDLP